MTYPLVHSHIVPTILMTSLFLASCAPREPVTPGEAPAPSAKILIPGELETIKQTIAAVTALPKQREIKDENSSARPDNMPKAEEPVGDPPKGAEPYAGLSEKTMIGVDTAVVHLSRDQPKSPSFYSPTPEKPPAWRQVGFASEILPVGKGLDPRLVVAVEGIDDRDFTYGFIIINEYLNPVIERRLAEAGIEILGPHSSAYKVKMPTSLDRLKSVVELTYVEWLGYAKPEQKIDGALRTALDHYAADLKEVPVIIHLFENDARGLFEKGRLREALTIGQYEADIAAYTAVVPVEFLSELSHQDYVLYIELDSPGQTGHDQSAAVMGVDYIRTGGSGTNFSGSSTILGILDTGFMVGSAAPTTHNDLNKFGCGRNFTSDSAGVWNDQNGHGTHVLGTVAGTGAGDNRNRGAATGIGGSGTTRIRAGKIWNSAGSSPSASWMRNGMDFMDDSSACDSGRPKIVSISGGARGTGQVGTDTRSRKLDNKVWQFKQAYIVCGGNTGSGAQTIWAPGVAKNALAVGNVLDNGFQTIGDANNNSSRGPTGDGRMKPNLVATGTTVTSARAGTTNGYTNMNGCSMATPHVSGIAATVMQHYPDMRDRPSLLRAHLMATGILHDDTTTPSDNDSGGRNTYGLGRVSTYAAHWARNNSNGWSTYWAARTITNKSWGYRDIQVPAGTDRLVVVMTWDEPAASAGASKAVDYDLDLWIDRNADCVPDSKGQCGEWASQSYDDNVEYIIINNPSAGTYRLKIVNWNAPSSGLPAAVVATVIRGDPTPNMSLSVTANNTSPAVGSNVQITTQVSNPSYIASGVHIALPRLPSGLSFLGVNTIREDGVTMNFTGNNFSLGNIVQGNSRRATWLFRVNSSGAKTLTFQAWSENGGTRTQSITITP